MKNEEGYCRCLCTFSRGFSQEIEISLESRACPCLSFQMSSSGLVRALLALPYPLFELQVVHPVLDTLQEVLGDPGSKKLFLLHWPTFSHLQPHSLPLEVIADGLLKAFQKEATEPETAEDDSLSLLLASAWIELHMDMYEFVESLLRETLGDFQAVQMIDTQQSKLIVTETVNEFGPLKSFLFCVLSSVRLHESSFEQLQIDAERAFAPMEQEMEDLQRSCETLEKKRVELTTPSPLSRKGMGIQPRSVIDSSNARLILSQSMDAGFRGRSSSTMSPESTGDDGHCHHHSGSATNLSLDSGLDNAPWTPLSRESAYCESGRRRGWQMMSARNVGVRAGAGSGSALHRRVQTESRSGWLEKQKNVNLLQSSCLVPESGGDSSAWKRRWVAIEAGKLLYFRGEQDADPLACIPLYLVSSIRTHPELGPCVFGVRCGHLVTFVFRASSEEEMSAWLFALQQWLAKSRLGNEALVHSILAVPRWWKKLRSKQSLEHYTALVERENANSVIRNCVVEVNCLRPQPRIADDYPFLNVCACSTQGHRPSMEDKHILCPDLASARRWDFEDSSSFGSTSMFAVFDGHGGEQAAVYVAEHFPAELSKQCYELTKLDMRNDASMFSETLKRVFESVDRGFLAIATDDLLEQPILAGSTAIIVFLHSNDFITAANLGDSRAVLSRDGIAVELSRDHKPNRPDERERIEMSGGWVTESLELDVSRLWRLNPRLLDAKAIPQELAGSKVGFVKVHRLNGELCVSRAFGDAECKGELKHEFWEDHSFTADVMSCEPEVLTIERQAADEFLIIACDGLWDVFESQEAVDYVGSRLKHYRAQSSTDRLVRSVEETPTGKSHPVLGGGLPDITKRASQDLVNEALTRGSQDNISIVLVILTH